MPYVLLKETVRFSFPRAVTFYRLTHGFTARKDKKNTYSPIKNNEYTQLINDNTQITTDHPASNLIPQSPILIEFIRFINTITSLKRSRGKTETHLEDLLRRGAVV